MKNEKRNKKIINYQVSSGIVDLKLTSIGKEASMSSPTPGTSLAETRVRGSRGRAGRGREGSKSAIRKGGLREREGEV